MVIGYKTFGSTSTTQNPTVVVLGIAPTWIRLTAASSQLSYGSANNVKQASLCPGKPNSSAHVLRLADNGNIVLSISRVSLNANGASFAVDVPNVNIPVLIEAGTD